MFANALKYELRQSAAPFLMLSGIVLALAMSARLDFFSLTDMPLLYVAFFGAAGVIVYRFHRTMFGQEAVFMFSIALSAAAQIALRLIAALILSFSSVAMIGAALMLQGEGMAQLMMSLSPGIGWILFFEVVLSAFFLSVIIGAILTFAHLPGCREGKTIWIVVWAAVIFGTISLLSSLTEHVAGIYLVIQLGGGVFISDTPAVPSSFAFSLNMLLWQAIVVPVLIFLMSRMTRKYQLLV